MGSEAILDFDKLLEPIAGENPAGVNLREDISPTSLYQTVKSARTRARAAERKIIEGDTSTSPDWRPILDLVPQALAEKTKDLELAAWLAEALLRQHGFPGLRDGFRLLRLLVERYWDNLHPMPDEEEGVANRVAPLGGLNGLDGADGTLIGPIFNIPLTDEGASEGPYARWHYRQAADVEGIGDPEKRQKRIDSGAITMDRINRAEAETSADFAKNLLEDLAGCIEEFDALSGLLDEKCGKDADGRPVSPPTSTIRNALKECHSVVEAICQSKFVSVAGNDSGEGAGAGEGNSGRGQPGQAYTGGKIRSRSEAFQALLQVAQFFKETEPHSPISYALERAVRWGKMPLPELLSELIAEESSRSSVFKLVGIPPPRDSSEG